MSNKAYDILKDIALILPLVITLVGAIMEIWNIPYTEQVVLTITAINAFVGGLVKIANTKYKKKAK